MKITAYIILLSLISRIIIAQNPVISPFSRLELRTDSMTYSSDRHFAVFEGEKHLCFQYWHENEIVELALFTKDQQIPSGVSLTPSADYEIVDSLFFVNDAYRCKIMFHGLTHSRFLKLQFRYDAEAGRAVEIIRLFPCTKTTLSFRPVHDELFIGEERIFDLLTNNAENISFQGEWTSGLPIDYRIEKHDGRLRLHVLPNELGVHPLVIRPGIVKPGFDAINNRIVNDPLQLMYDFTVKSGRLRFLNIDRKEITLDEKTRSQGIEIQLDDNKLLKINKTYRIENQEEPGGTLLAEIFTRSYLSNNKVLCYLKTYNYHRSSEGYLYIKDGDETQFITNFNITPAVTLTKLWVMREGGDWNADLSVYPGETIGVKIEGQALYKAKFHFEDLVDLTTDTLTRNEHEVIMKLKVPMNINKKRVGLYNYSGSTGFGLVVREYENPKPFDYVSINYGDINRVLASTHGPILFDRTIRDIIISFNTDKIDTENKLYGKQYLALDIRVTGPNNELVDMKTLSNIVICPSDRSPRYSFYDRRNCSQEEISLNKHIRRSTSDLEDWSRIYLSLKTNPEKYGGEYQQKELEIILKKRYKFDIDVSFPAGLVTVSKNDKNGEDTEFSNLYGISMAMVAQFAFYHPEKIAKLRPFRVGAGFLALDAFNFQSEKQDLGLVALASIYPTTRDKKLAFPLYIGGGYQFKNEKWMLLIGPGISVKL